MDLGCGHGYVAIIRLGFVRGLCGFCIANARFAPDEEVG
jgi:hypothetical protein